MENKVVLNIGEQTLILKFGEFDEEINVDEITSIDYSNLYGEIVTVSALLNRIGLLKAEAESIYSKTKFDMDIYEANLCKRMRREANVSEGNKFTITDEKGSMSVKLTEKSLEEAVILDKVYQNYKKAVIEAQKNVSFCDSLYWGIQSKDRKLSVLMKGCTPEEFYNEIIEGAVNGMMIKKVKIV